MTILIPGLPPSVNHCYGRRKRSKRLYLNDEGVTFKNAAAYIAKIEAKKNKWLIIPSGRFIHLAIDFEFKDKVFSDPNNLIKILIDSLQGILYENDKWVLPLVWRARITGNKYTRVQIKPNGEYFEIPELMDMVKGK